MSTTKLIIKGGTIVADGKSYVADILVLDGKIAEIGNAIVADEETEVFDANGCIVT